MDNLDKLLKSTSLNGKKTVPPMVWQNIDATIKARLHTKPLKGIVIKLLVLIGASSALYFTLTENNEQTEVVASTEVSNKEVLLDRNNLRNNRDINAYSLSANLAQNDKTGIDKMVESEVSQPSSDFYSQPQSESAFLQNNSDKPMSVSNLVQSQIHFTPTLDYKVLATFSPMTGEFLGQELHTPSITLKDKDFSKEKQNEDLKSLESQEQEKKGNLSIHLGQSVTENKWTAGLDIGTSFFDVTMFNDKFRTGALSNRDFQSNGMEISLHLNRTIRKKLSIGIDLGYDRKNASFNYDVLTSEHTYRKWLSGETIQMTELSHSLESCGYVVNGVSSAFNTHTLNFAINSELIVIQRVKFDLGTGLSLGTNLYSAVNIVEQQNIAIPKPSDNFLNEIGVTAFVFAQSPLFKGEQWNLKVKSGFRHTAVSKEHSFYTKSVSQILVNIGLNYSF
jgi:hypothetical protein